MAETNTMQKTRYIRPRAAVNETRDGKIRVVLEMPGVGSDQLSVKVENNELQIHGRREPAADMKYLLRERPQGDYMQSYTLDETVDPAKIDAVLEKGILTVTLDVKEHVKPRTIQIRGA
jgi:HSP20 family molecular chaperone IbpA